MLVGKITSKNIGPYSYHCSGIEHGIDTAFGMVPHDQTAKGQICLDERIGTVLKDLNRRIVVLEIGAIGISTEIAPFAE